MSDELPIKIVSFLRRRSDLSPAEFERYYETHHAPLALSLLPGIARYTRSYINPDSMTVDRTGGDLTPPCDVITEIWFRTEADYQKFQAACADPEIVKTFVEDEARFMDMQSVKSYTVREVGGNHD